MPNITTIYHDSDGELIVTYQKLQNYPTTLRVSGDPEGVAKYEPMIGWRGSATRRQVAAMVYSLEFWKR